MPLPYSALRAAEKIADDGRLSHVRLPPRGMRAWTIIGPASTLKRCQFTGQIVEMIPDAGHILPGKRACADGVRRAGGARLQGRLVQPDLLGKFFTCPD